MHILQQRGINFVTGSLGSLAIEQAASQAENKAYTCADLCVDRLYLGLSGHLSYAYAVYEG